MLLAKVEKSFKDENFFFVVMLISAKYQKRDTGNSIFQATVFKNEITEKI